VLSVEHIRRSIEELIGYLKENPEEAQHTDPAATATLESGLRFRAEGPNGAVAVTDMQPVVGGEGSAPSPAWFMRAALATCDATVIAMKAALEDIELTTLEVAVDSESDSCGLLGVDEAIQAGPLNVRIRVRIGAKDVGEEKLRKIVKWAEAHSPVADAICRAIPFKAEIKIA
jgi:uncharacterized OsmC-like protein